jgi:hypothetical protein
LPVLRSDLLQKPVKVGDARFGVVSLEVDAVASRPSRLVGPPIKASERRLTRVAFLVLTVFRAV